MDALSSGRFWFGILIGIGAYYAWTKYQERKPA